MCGCVCVAWCTAHSRVLFQDLLLNYTQSSLDSVFLRIHWWGLCESEFKSVLSSSVARASLDLCVDFTRSAAAPGFHMQVWWWIDAPWPEKSGVKSPQEKYERGTVFEINSFSHSSLSHVVHVLPAVHFPISIRRPASCQSSGWWSEQPSAHIHTGQMYKFNEGIVCA